MGNSFLHANRSISNRDVGTTEPSRGGYTGPDGQRVLVRILILVLLSVLGGALLAPWVARLLWVVGRSVDGWEGLRDITFIRVAGRCVILVLALGAIGWGRFGAFGSFRQIGLTRLPGWRGGWVAGFLMGVASMALLLGLAWSVGAVVWAGGDWLRLAGTLVGALGGAIVVGLVEEVAFRGVLFGGLRACCRWWLAAAGASLVFSAVHFATPVPATGIAHAHWVSGLALLPDLFRQVHADSHYMPFALSLWVMGLCLCLVYDRYRSLYPVWGLHAGWIWVLYGWGRCFRRVEGIEVFWFGAGSELAKGHLALLLLGGITIGLVAARRRTPRAETSAAGGGDNQA